MSKTNFAIKRHGAVVSLLLERSLCGEFAVIGCSLELALLAAVFVIVARFAEPLARLVLSTAILELIEALLAVPPQPHARPAARPAR